MADSRVPPENLPAELVPLAGKVKALRKDEVPQTLTSKLVPIVDRLRHLKTTFGIRPYQVFLVHVEWTGTRPGDGTPREIARIEVLPTPKITDMSGTTEVMRALGRTEEGGITVSEVSVRFAEDDLMGRTPDLQDPLQPRTNRRNTEFYWEVIENRSTHPGAYRRRYVPSAAPYMSRDTLQWRIQLTRQDYDRGRSGTFTRQAF